MEKTTMTVFFPHEQNEIGLQQRATIIVNTPNSHTPVAVRVLGLDVYGEELRLCPKQKKDHDCVTRTLHEELFAGGAKVDVTFYCKGLNSGGCKTKKPARVCLAVSLVYHEGVMKLTSLPFTVKGNRRQKTKRSSCSGSLREMLSVTTVIEAPTMVVEDMRGGAVLITKSEAEDDNGEENLIPEQEEFPKVDQNEVIGINNIKREREPSPPPPPVINNSPSRVRVSSFVPVVSPLRREPVVSENNNNNWTPPRSNNNNPHIRTIPQYIKPILVQPNNIQTSPDYYDYITGPPLRPTFTPNDYFIPPDEDDPGVIVINGRTSNYNEPNDHENNLVDVHGMYLDPRWVNLRMKQEGERINHYDIHHPAPYPNNEYFPNKRMRIHQSGNNNSTPHQ